MFLVHSFFFIFTKIWKKKTNIKVHVLEEGGGPVVGWGVYRREWVWVYVRILVVDNSLYFFFSKL